MFGLIWVWRVDGAGWGSLEIAGLVVGFGVLASHGLVWTEIVRDDSGFAGVARS